MYEIPKSLEACMEADHNAVRIKRWGEVLNVLGWIFSLGILAAGLYYSYQLALTRKISIFSAQASFDDKFFYIGAGITILVSIIIFLLFRFWSNAFRGFAGLIQNTRVSCNISLYEASKREEVDKLEKFIAKKRREEAEHNKTSYEDSSQQDSAVTQYDDIHTDPERAENFVNNLADNGKLGKS